MEETSSRKRPDELDRWIQRLIYVSTTLAF